MSWDVDDVEAHADVLADGLPEPIIDRDPGDECGYEFNDPKHPDFYDVFADVWDNRDSK